MHLLDKYFDTSLLLMMQKMVRLVYSKRSYENIRIVFLDKIVYASHVYEVLKMFHDHP